MRVTARIVTWLLAALIGLAAAQAHAAADRRVALVIGNGLYQATEPLSNPRNDAKDLAASLQKLGFEVILVIDANKQDFERALARFSRAAQGSDAAMIYYAGHALQFQGTNYLVPVDAHLDDEFSLNSDMVTLNAVIAALDTTSGIKLLILDACRNNPLAERLLKGSRGLDVPEGLAKTPASYGTLVAYSTQANKVARDGEGRNSPFTKALLDQISVPGVEVLSMFRRVIAEVYQRTDKHQLPEVSLQLVGDFYFNPAPAPAPLREATADPLPPVVADPVHVVPAAPVPQVPAPAIAPATVLPPAPVVASIPPAALLPDLGPAIASELRRVGCLDGAGGEDWASTRVVTAVARADRRLGGRHDERPTDTFLGLLKSQIGPLCPNRPAHVRRREHVDQAAAESRRSTRPASPRCVEQAGQKFCF